MASALIHELVKRGNKIAFVVDSEELIKQTEWTLNTTVSVVKAGYDKLFNADNPTQIIMLQTFFARAEKLPDMNLDYIVIDEVHVGWQKARMNELLRIYSDAKIVGLSATPINSKGYLLEGFEDFINEVQTADLIKLGYLAKPICYAPQNCVIDLSNVSLVGNEYNSN
jgi:superfamily II DNA or RNA helicase